jgi:MoaA/NifB/PqqE/SkfB family radical SAM enzyme
MGNIYKLEEFQNSREILADVVPLSVPFQLVILVTSFCNFRCNFCIQSNYDNSPCLHTDKSMNLEDFKLYIDKLSDYIHSVKDGRKIKKLAISGLGETLTHPDIPEMIAYAKKANIADQVKIFTNASLLTPTLSDALINAGLDLIHISIEGLSPEQYKEIAGVKINWEKFLENIEYYYQHRKNCTVFIKIADLALHSESDKAEFYKIFQPISDLCNIDHITSVNGFLSDDDKHNYYNIVMGEYVNQKICNLPFRILELTCNGDIYDCALYREEGFVVPCIGNLKNSDLKDIWNVGAHKQHCLDLITDNRKGVCVGCKYYHAMSSQNDSLDNNTEVIKRKLECMNQ